jgi:hypothetical protein
MTRLPLSLLLFFCALSVLLHLRSFTVPHQAGDEVVYRTLAGEMEWNLSHYTTMDRAPVNGLPWPLYRSPLFIHPPLLPLVLKLGNAIGDSTPGGLVFMIASMCLLLAFVARTLRSFEASQTVTGWALALTTLCPVLLVTTTRLIPDGLLAIYLFCGISLAIESFRDGSSRKMLVAGLLLVVGFNAKYTALVALPILPALQAFHLHARGGHDDLARTIRDPRNWRLFAVLLVPVLLFGLQHDYRFLMQYGTLSPAPLVTPDAGATLSPWVESVYARTHLHMLWYLLAIFPLLSIAASRRFHRTTLAILRDRRWECVYVLIFLYLVGILFAFQHREMRYMAPAFPFFYVSIALTWRYHDVAWRRRVAYLVVLSLVLMVTTGYANTIAHPTNAKIVPSLIQYLPGLAKFYL